MKILVLLNINYESITNSPKECIRTYEIINEIVQYSKSCDRCYIFDDLHHPDDDEFNYLPRHGLWTISAYPIEKDIKCLCHRQRKLTLDATHTEHVRQLLEKHKGDQIIVGGFAASMDVIPTCLGLIDCKFNVRVDESLISDISEGILKNSINYLRLMNLLTIPG